MKTCGQLTLLDLSPSISSAADGLARGTVSRDCAEATGTNGAGSLEKSCASLTEWLRAPGSSCLRMSPDWCPSEADGISLASFPSSGGGIMWDASGCWTLNTLDWPRDAAVCSLSLILEPEV